MNECLTVCLNIYWRSGGGEVVGALDIGLDLRSEDWGIERERRGGCLRAGLTLLSFLPCTRNFSTFYLCPSRCLNGYHRAVRETE